MTHSFDLAAAPGHLIRRAHQISVAIFNEHLSAADVTPVQFAILNALHDTPGVDQITLAKRVAFDPATSGSVIGRLEAKGWVARQPHATDRRRKLLVVTPQGLQALASMQSAVAETQMAASCQPTSQASRKECNEQQALLHHVHRCRRAHVDRRHVAPVRRIPRRVGDPVLAGAAGERSLSAAVVHQGTRARHRKSRGSRPAHECC